MILMDPFTHLLPSLIIYLLNSGMTHSDFLFLSLGSIIPDIDHLLGFLFKNIKKSWASDEKRLKGPQKLFFFPRTPLHSLWGLLFLSLPIFFLFGSKTFYFSIGIFIHLLVDSLDESGVYWLYPHKWIHGKIPASYVKGRKNVGFPKLSRMIMLFSIASLTLFLLFIF
ncbi:MAG: hypothetical protein GF368_01350 [Candidatus Aenigmarchaeota archaeon]|nr:hypothetical protein [Candidatus Aenigmarchaeota archaeon]